MDFLILLKSIAFIKEDEDGYEKPQNEREWAGKEIYWINDFLLCSVLIPQEESMLECLMIFYTHHIHINKFYIAHGVSEWGGWQTKTWLDL